jgi:hypothetical protein
MATFFNSEHGRTSIVKVVALSASKGDQLYCGRAQGNKNPL